MKILQLLLLFSFGLFFSSAMRGQTAPSSCNSACPFCGLSVCKVLNAGNAATAALVSLPGSTAPVVASCGASSTASKAGLPATASVQQQLVAGKKCDPAQCDPSQCDPADCDPAKCDPAPCMPASCKPANGAKVERTDKKL